MNAEKLTQKSAEAIRSAQEIALEYGNPQIEQVHLLWALLQDSDCLLYTSIHIPQQDTNHKGPPSPHLSRDTAPEGFNGCYLTPDSTQSATLFPQKSPAAGNPRGRAPGLALLGEILRRALLHRHAGVVVLENLHIALPLLGHGVGAVLAHPHAVAKAGDGKGKGIPGQRHVKGRRAQGEDLPGLGPGDGHPADGDGVDAPALGALDGPHPAGGVALQAGRGLGFQEGRCV